MSGSSPLSPLQFTEAQRQQKLLEIRKELLQRQLHRFVKEAWPLVEGARELKWNWHMDAVCAHLQALEDGTLGKRKLMVNVPPRTSKSTLVTVMFPLWVWTRRPWIQFMFASYSFDLSRQHAYKRRLILESPWYQGYWSATVQLSHDRNNIAEISNTSKGVLATTSVGGSVTGKGGDYLILDDPNSAEEMESETQRATCLGFVDGAWSTRANDAKTVREVVIQQRTHEKDVTGHLLEKEPDQWVHLKIAMEYDPSRDCVTPIWRDPRKAKGELIDATRFPQEYLEGLKIKMGTYRYSGQYDQEPAPIGGGIVKTAWLRPWIRNAHKQIVLKEFLAGADYNLSEWDVTRFATVDLAFSEEEIGEKKVDDPDYSVIAAWAAFIMRKEQPVLILLDLLRERIEAPDFMDKMVAFHEYWKFSVIGFETIQAQKALFQYARRAALPVREISTKNDPDALFRIDKDKVSRLVAATPLMEARRFFIPAYAPWRAEYEKELTRFPLSAHDDQADCTSMAVPIAMKLARSFIPREQETPARIRGPHKPAENTVQAIGPADWRSSYPGGVAPSQGTDEGQLPLVNNFGD